MDNTERYLVLQKDVDVPANNSGESTGILVENGDIIHFSSAGRWCWGGGNDCSSANGTPGRPGKDEQPSLVSRSFYGALLGRISDDPLFVIGIAKEVTANRDGEIVFRINDPIYSDNSGYLRVAVEVYRRKNK